MKKKMMMTDLMKRYEAETGEKPKKKVLVMYSTKRYGWGREKNHLFYTNKFIKWVFSIVAQLLLENAQLEEQLRWRFGSENPEKEGDYLAKWSNYSDPINLVYKNGKWFMLEDESPELVSVRSPEYWIPIPPLGVKDEYSY